MTPYYQDEWATIYHCRADQVLSELIDDMPLIVTDPPYGIGFDYGSADFRDTEGDFKESIRPFVGMPVALLQYPEEMMRLVVPVLGPPAEVITWVYNSNLPRQTRLWGIWEARVDFRRVKQPAKNPECTKVRNHMVSSYDWIGDIQQVKGNGSEKTAHPCQIPVDLVSRIIRLCDPDSVLDPFMGSGTTLRAARDLRIQSVGIEYEERYCEIAAKRLAQEVLAL